MFGLFSSGLATTKELTTTNAGFATLSEEDVEGMGYMQGGLPGTFRSHFDRYRY